MENGHAAGEASVDLIDGSLLLLAGFSAERVEAVRDAGRLVGSEALVKEAATIEEVESVFASAAVASLAFGPGIAPEAALDWLDTLGRRHPYQDPSCLLAIDLAPDQEAALHEALTSGRVFFVAPSTLAPGDLARLAWVGVERFRERLLGQLAAVPHVENRRAVVFRKLQTTRETLLETTAMDGAGDAVFDALGELTGFDEVRLWRFDPWHHELELLASEGLAPDASGHEASRASAAAGLVAYAATTGATVATTAATEDPRWDADTDGALARLVAAPVAGAGAQVLGVLAVSYRADPPGSDTAGSAIAPETVRVVEALAEMLVPLFAQTAPRPQPGARFGARERAGGGTAVDLFRRQAVEANARGFAERGTLLRADRGFTRSTWWLLAVGFGLALVLAAVVRVDEFASGPAVRDGDAVEVLLSASGPDGVSAERLAEMLAEASPAPTGRWLSPDGSTRAVRVESVDGSPAAVEAFQRRLDPSRPLSAGDSSPRPDSATVVRAHLLGPDESETLPVLGEVELAVGSRSVLSFLLPDLESPGAEP